MPKATFRQTRTPLKLEHLQKAREDPMGPDALQSGVVFGIWIIGSPSPHLRFWGKHLGGNSCKLELIASSHVQRSELLELASCLEFEMHFPKQTLWPGAVHLLPSFVLSFIHPLNCVVPQPRSCSQAGAQKVGVHMFWINWLYLESVQPFPQRLSLVQLGWSFWSQGLEINGLFWYASCIECKLFNGRAVFPSSLDTWHSVGAWKYRLNKFQHCPFESSLKPRMRLCVVENQEAGINFLTSWLTVELICAVT